MLVLRKLRGIGRDLFRHACLMGLEGLDRSAVTVPIAVVSCPIGWRSSIPSIPRWRMRSDW